MKVSCEPALVTKNEHFPIPFCVMNVSCDPALVMENEHFLMLCHEGQLWPHVSNEKWALSHAVSWWSEFSFFLWASFYFCGHQHETFRDQSAMEYLSRKLTPAHTYNPFFWPKRPLGGRKMCQNLCCSID